MLDTIRGRTISSEKLADVCGRLMEISRRAGIGQSLPEPPTLFEPNEADLPYVGAPVPMVAKDSASEGNAGDNRSATIALNFEKIKDDLVNLTDRNKSILLQALRWKISKASNPAETKFATKELI